MNVNPTPSNVQHFYHLERELFVRLVGKLYQDPVTVKWVMCLWLWLESVGHHEFIRRIAAYTDDIVLAFLKEGYICLSHLAISAHEKSSQKSELFLTSDHDNKLFPTSDNENELPLTSTLIAEPIDLHFSIHNCSAIIKKVCDIFESVVSFIFDDAFLVAGTRVWNDLENQRVLSDDLHVRLHEERNRFQRENIGGTMGMQSPLTSALLSQPRPSLAAQSDMSLLSRMAIFHGLDLTSFRESPPLPHILSQPRSILNPMASPYNPMMCHTPKDHRSMFITFSRGYPISREDIMEFFTRRFGPCVEVVLIERAAPGMQPLYGRIVFTSASKIAEVLNGRQTVKFMIKGKHLWARVYVPRHNIGSNQMMD